MSIRDRLKAKSKELKEITIDGEKLFLRKMTGAERVKHFSTLRDESKVAESSAILIALSLCDESGNRLYTDDEISTLNEELTTDIIDKLADEIGKFNGFIEEELKAEIKN